jgi:hypothetical protein
MIRDMTKIHSLLPSLALVAIALASPVSAQTPQFLGSYTDWNVYEFNENSQKICYMASVPKKQTGNYTRRGNPAVLVTRRPGPQVLDEVSVQPGYTYGDGSEVSLTVDTTAYSLFTRGEHAWTRNSEEDRSLINQMKRGSTMVVRGESSKQTTSEDTYSLLGFTKAYEAMVAACGG